MDHLNFGPKWMWQLGCVFAVIGVLAVVAGIITGLIYLVEQLKLL